MAISRKHLMNTTLILAVGTTMAGCYSDSRDSMIRADVTPELETLYQRQVDMDNAGALMADENGRMFMEDLGRFWLVDRSSHLTPEPSPRP